MIDRTETIGNFCFFGFGYGTSRLVVGNVINYGARFSSAYYWTPISGSLNCITWNRASTDINSAGNNSIRMYDGTNDKGVLQGNNSLDVSTYTRININGENAYGNYRNVFSTACIRVYDRALTPSEIAYNYKIDKIRFIDA